MAMNAPAPLYPARMFMRPIDVDLGTQDFTLGGSGVVFQLRQLGYLQRLLVHVSGSYTVANADLVFLGLNPYNIVSKFLIQTPGSALPPINLGGASLHIWNLRSADFAPFRKGFRIPASAGALDAALGTTSVVGAPFTLDGSPFFDAIVDQMVVTVGAQTLHFWWVLPFAMSDEDIRGILPLGNSTVTNLIVTPAAAADIVTTAANLTSPDLAIQVTQTYLTPPPAGSPIIGGGVDVSWTQAYDEISQPLVATGLQRILLVPNYTLLGVLHGIVIDSKAASLVDINLLNFRVNSSWLYEPPGLTPAVVATKQAGQQGRALPSGYVLYDQDILGQADWINTQAITEIESDITVGSGASLDAGDQIVTSTRRLVLTQR